jgi:hypothetical protein
VSKPFSVEGAIIAAGGRNADAALRARAPARHSPQPSKACAQSSNGVLVTNAWITNVLLAAVGRDI